MRARKRNLLIGAAASMLIVAAGAGYELRDSWRAAYRAFRNPALVEQPGHAGRLPPAPGLGDYCPPAGAGDSLLDEQLARDFTVVGEIDLDDAESKALASLRPTDLPVDLTRRTLRFVRFFTEHRNGREIFETWYERSGKYRPAIVHELREAGLPEDLAWVSAVESAFDPRATSPADAAGLWQFMPETATLYGLELSPWVDERRSLSRSTTAAVTHLRDLFERLGSWELALAAYNMGYSGLLAAITKLNESRQQQGQKVEQVRFAHLAQNRLLPRETTDYVPKITAVAIVAANLARFQLDRIQPAPALQLATLTVPAGTRLQTIARAAGISTAQLADYNPELLRGRVPPDGGDYPVTLPADRFDHARAALPAYLDHEILELQNTLPLPALPQELKLGTEDAATVTSVFSGGLERPRHLGNNRLPAFPIPGISPPVKDGPVVTLPGGLASLDEQLRHIKTGYERPTDPFSLLRGVARGPAEEAGGPAPVASDRRIDEQLRVLAGPAPLSAAPPYDEEQLPGGIRLRLRRDTTAPRVAITVRLGTEEHSSQLDPDELIRDRTEELRFTEVVPRAELELGLTIAVGQLAVLLEQSRSGPVAALRAELNRQRRATLQAQKYGRAWVALSEALFPPGDEAYGRLIWPTRPSEALLRDRLLLSNLAVQRRPAGATISLVGDFGTDQARTAVKRALADLGLEREGQPAPSPDLGRGHEPLILEAPVKEPRYLFGWRGVGLTAKDHAPLEVAIEVLAGPKKSLLVRELVERQVAAQVRLKVDHDWTATAVAFELTPVAGQSLLQIVERIDALIERLATSGPGPLELAYARGMVAWRLERSLERAAGQPTKPPSPDRILADKLWDTLKPGQIKRTLKAVNRVDAAAVKRIFGSYLSRDKRYLVATVPEAPAEDKH